MRTRGSGRTFLRGSIWWVAYFHHAKEIRESSHSTDQKDAVRLLKQRIREVGADQIGLKTFVPNQDRLRVAALLDALEADYRLRSARSLPSLLSHLKHVRQAFGDWRATELTVEAVDRYIEQGLAAGRAAASINFDTQMLGRAFRLAVERKHLSAAPKFRYLAVHNARQGFFEWADFEAVVAELPEYLSDFARFGYLSGWRKAEIRSLLWADVDLEGRVLRLRAEHAKNKVGRVLALEGELWSLIERQSDKRSYRQPDGSIVFAPAVFHRHGRPIGDFRKAWATACQRAGVPGKFFHDLRRTAVRNMVRAGVPERVAMSISGHKTRAIFDRYDIVNEADLREATLKTQAYLNATSSERKVVALKIGNRNPDKTR